MSDESLHRQLLLDHGQHPRNRHLLPDATHHATMNNPLCGDQVTLFLSITNGHIDAACFAGQGCALSTASASLLTERLNGLSIDQARALLQQFAHFMNHADAQDPSLEKFQAFAGARQFPVRVRCALLPFMALRQALDSAHTMSHHAD